MDVLQELALAYMYKYGVEATEIKTSRRINSGNLANAHMFFARAEHLARTLYNSS